MRDYKFSNKLERFLPKLYKKDRNLYEQLLKKIDEIINSHNIESYKNLRHNMKDSKRVHIGHFVLIFVMDHAKKIVSFEDYAHHDKIYR